jgi:hypothetical protein
MVFFVALLMIPGKGGYHVHHTCARPMIDTEKGWENTSQIQRSQLDASQARKGKRKAGDNGPNYGWKARNTALQDQ